MVKFARFLGGIDRIPRPLSVDCRSIARSKFFGRSWKHPAVILGRLPGGVLREVLQRVLGVVAESRGHSCAIDFGNAWGGHVKCRGGEGGELLNIPGRFGESLREALGKLHNMSWRIQGTCPAHSPANAVASFRGVYPTFAKPGGNMSKRSWARSWGAP